MCVCASVTYSVYVYYTEIGMCVCVFVLCIAYLYHTEVVCVCACIILTEHNTFIGREKLEEMGMCVCV